MTESITVITADTSTDRYGDTVRDWSTPTSRTVTGCRVAPRTESRAEDNADRSAVVDGWTIYAPPGTAIDAHDRIAVRGETHDVVGTPAVWSDTATIPAGVVVTTRRVQG